MTTYTKEYLATAHKRCSNNLQDFAADTKAGCFYCCRIYLARELADNPNNADGDDAWCAKCNTDSVIIDDGINEFTLELLQALRKHYFF